MRIRRRAWVIGIFSAILLLLVGVGSVYFQRLQHLEEYRAEILAEVEKALGRRVFFEKGDFSLGLIPSFAFTKVVIREKDGLTDFMTADRVSFKIALLPLLKQSLVLKDLELEKPSIVLKRSPDGFNISDLFEQKTGGRSFDLKAVKVKQGLIRFHDTAVVPEGLTTTLSDVDLAMAHLGRDKKSSIKFAASLPESHGKIAISGSLRMPSRSPLIQSVADLDVVASGIDAGRYWPYYRAYVPFRQVLGKLEVNSRFKGRLSQFTSKGAIAINGLRFDYPQIFHALLTPAKMHFRYDFELTPDDVLVKALDLSVDDLNVKGNCAIKNIHSGDPRITAEARTSRFRLEKFAAYVPYGIIVDDVAAYISEHIKGGVYRLDTGRLDGLASEIAHMERGTNYNVLHIAGRVEDGIVSYGTAIPTFNSIQGRLEMKGKDFLLQDMKGKFGSSPFSLQGKIADYPLNSPSSYPFNMVITPRAPESRWLFGWSGSTRPNIVGDSQLRFSGDGTTGNYSLSGEWDLSPASVTVSDLLAKPAGRAGNIVFNSNLDRNQVRFPTLRVTLAPLVLNCRGAYKFAAPESLTFDASSGLIDVTQVAPMLPFLKKHKFGGNIRGSIHGEGNGISTSQLSWNGSITSSNLFWQPPEQEKPFSGLTGTVSFHNARFETSRLSGRKGNTPFTARGAVEGLIKPAGTVTLDVPGLDPGDFGYLSPPDLKINNLHAELALKDQNLLLKTVKAQVNGSDLTITGSVNRQSDADLVVTSPSLDIKALMLLSKLERPQGQSSAQKTPLNIKASVTAESAHYEDIAATDFMTSFAYKGNVLSLENMHCYLFGGHLTAKGVADLSAQVPRYQLAFDLGKASAEVALRKMGVKKQELTGTMSIKGEVSAKGSGAADIKKSASGTISLRCENGMLRRFPVLSKVFSILNVSQLLKFKLPDMVSGGMPYNEITGTFTLKNGEISTKDFFIAGNALNISAVGKIDMVRNDIDATVGVQPLQAIDKAVSTIPIVGWILAGKDRNLISAYFEAKGKVNDPKVTAIPVKSMANGVLNIFKRLFQLPVKLVTDTGEVILGR